MGVNTTRLPQSDENVIKIHPLLVGLLPDRLFHADRCVDRGDRDGNVDRVLPEIRRFGCGSFQHHSGPYIAKLFEPECHLFEPQRFREVYQIPLRFP